MVCAFDDRDGFRRPIWVAGVDKDRVPDAVREIHPVIDEFGVQSINVFDVFEGVPGDEVVVTYVHGDWSQATLRIYDLAGNLIFEIWHDGGIGMMQWVEGSQLLVMAGGDEYLKFNDSRFRDSQKMFASVVFALRPQPGYRSRRFLAPLDADEDSVLAWYRVFLPHATDTSILEKFHIDHPVSLEGPARCVLVNVFYRDKNGDAVGGLQLVVDEHGEEVPGSRSLHDIYVQDQCVAGRHVFPDPDTVRLVPYEEVLATIPKPPTKPGRAEAAGAP